MDTPLESELVDIVDLIADKKRGDALDKINDYLYGKAQDVIDQYKQSVASSYFDEPTDTPEEWNSLQKTLRRSNFWPKKKTVKSVSTLRVYSSNRK